MKQSITNNGKILALFAVACTAIVGITYELTKGRIQQQEEIQLLATLNSIIDHASYDNDMSKLCVKVSDESLGTKDTQTIYLATLQEKPVAAAITTTAPDGYNGKIQLIVALTAKGTISGVRALNHKETPGLGDKIELRKSNWVLSFNDKTDNDITDSHWAVKKDGGSFDQFTGATITPRAVVNAVKRTALYFKANQEALFSAPNDCGNSNVIK